MKTNQSSELLDLMIALIEDDDEPIHYKMLASAIQDSGAYDLAKMYKRPSDSIYGILIGGIRNGCTRYVFLKNGIFAKASIAAHAEELITVPKPVISIPKEKKRRLSVLNAPPTHKDCKFMQYTDLQLLADVQDNHYGHCVLADSGKIYPHKDGPACEFFIQKDMIELEKEHKRRLQLQVLIEEINKVVIKSSRSGNRSEYKEKVA